MDQVSLRMEKDETMVVRISVLSLQPQLLNLNQWRHTYDVIIGDSKSRTGRDRVYFVLNVVGKSEFRHENEVLGKFRIGFGVLGLWNKIRILV